jgi:hypothetical protein
MERMGKMSEINYYEPSMERFHPKVCGRCGGWIIDTATHSEWHCKQESSQPMPTVGTTTVTYHPEHAHRWVDRIDEDTEEAYTECDECHILKPDAPVAKERGSITETLDRAREAYNAARCEKDEKACAGGMLAALRCYDKRLREEAAVLYTMDFDSYEMALEAASERLLGKDTQ